MQEQSTYLPNSNKVLFPEINAGTHVCEKILVEVYGNGPHLVLIVDDGITQANGGLPKLKEQFLDQIKLTQGIKFVVVRPVEQIISTSLTSTQIRRRIDHCVSTCTDVVSLLSVTTTDALLELSEFQRSLLDAVEGSQLLAVIADGLMDSRYIYGYLSVKNGFEEIQKFLREVDLDGLLYRYSASLVPAEGIPSERQIKKEPGKLAELLTQIAGVRAQELVTVM